MVQQYETRRCNGEVLWGNSMANYFISCRKEITFITHKPKKREKIKQSTAITTTAAAAPETTTKRTNKLYSLIERRQYYWVLNTIRGKTFSKKKPTHTQANANRMLHASETLVTA